MDNSSGRVENGIPESKETISNFQPSRKKVEISEIISITPGRHHAWCESNVGRIRKQLKSLSAEIIRTYEIINGRINNA